MGKKKPQESVLKKIDPELQWKLGAKLGEGTFGSVFMASNSEGQVLAAKVCQPKDDSEYEDLKQEAEIVIRCNNIYILKAFVCYDWCEKIWMFLELCHGGALDHICSQLEGFDEPTTRIILYQCTKGLQYLHESNIIHRDIKLQNIMLTSQGYCKLADFGVSAVLSSPTEVRGTFIGTPYWMAPEVIHTETNQNFRYDFRCDVYSLGITAHECVNVVPPGYELNPVQIFLHRARNESPELKDAENWSSDFKKFVNACVTKNPTKRPTAAQLLNYPFLTGNDLDSTDRLVELYKIKETIVVEQEFADEDEMMDDESEQTTDSLHDSDEARSEKDVSPSDSNNTRASPALPCNTISGKRTVRRTFRYNVGGVEKKRTVIQVIDSDNKAEFERQKSMRDKIINQMKLLRIHEQREQRKLEETQKLNLNDLLAKHKAEFDTANERYVNEIDIQGKLLTKEVDKKRTQLKLEFERSVRKVRALVEKEIKTHQSATKSKNKAKYDPSYLAYDFVQNLQATKLSEMKCLYETQNIALVEFCMALVTSKNGHLEDLLKSLIILRLQQLNEVFTTRKTHICAMLDLILQQRSKSDQKEIQISIKYMQDKIDAMKRDHAQILRDMPKILKANNKKNIDAMKKNLRKTKARNEKELLQKRNLELNEAMELEIRNTKATQEEAIRQVELVQEKEIKEIQEYQDEKNRATHRAYQDQLYQRYVDDESLCKAELLKLYLLIRRRQQDFETELQTYKDVDLSISVSPDIFN